MPGKEYSSECCCVTCEYYRGTKETTLLGTGVILLKTDTDTRIPLTIKREYGEAVIDLVVWVITSRQRIVLSIVTTIACLNHWRIYQMLDVSLYRLCKPWV